MEEIGNTEDEYELKIWELIKTEGKKLEEFRIEKENQKNLEQKKELEWKLLRAGIKFLQT